MKYDNMTEGEFVSRPNRFIANVLINGENRVCHVKNTGRCRELLQKGAKVIVTRSDNPARKTKYDLIAVYKNGILINMDSVAQASPGKRDFNIQPACACFRHAAVGGSARRGRVQNRNPDFACADFTRYSGG